LLLTAQDASQGHRHDCNQSSPAHHDSRSRALDANFPRSDRAYLV
jgi:hypothetical protein